MTTPFKVRMMAFGRTDDEVRIVDVPDERLAEATDELGKLGLIFELGQNDFQPKQHPSVSVGDVIELDGKLHLVKPMGFATMDEDEFDKYRAIPRRDRSLHAYGFKAGADE